MTHRTEDAGSRLTTASQVLRSVQLRRLREAPVPNTSNPAGPGTEGLVGRHLLHTLSVHARAGLGLHD